LFKGRLHFRQYIKTKRARFGIKLYELTTDNGITLDVLVYCGKGMYYAEDNQYESMATTERIPIELMRPFLGRGHVLYTDNFYTAPSTAKFLLVHETYLCGTVKNNRKNYCKTIKHFALEKGQATFFEGEFKTPKVDPDGNPAVNDDVPTQKLLACKFRAIQDKANKKPKIVFMLSSLHNASMVDTGKTDNDGYPIIKPAMIKAYNQHMGGVDRVDQQLHTVQALRKSYKWYKKLAFCLILQAALNAHKIFIEVTPNEKDKKLSFIDFLFRCIKQMVNTQLLDPIVPRNDDLSRLHGRHFNVMIPRQGNSNRKDAVYVMREKLKLQKAVTSQPCTIVRTTCLFQDCIPVNVLRTIIPLWTTL
jgi:hypothetical protein